MKKTMLIVGGTCYPLYLCLYDANKEGAASWLQRMRHYLNSEEHVDPATRRSVRDAVDSEEE